MDTGEIVCGIVNRTGAGEGCYCYQSSGYIEFPDQPNDC
jgi:hypothetical protein